MNAGVNARRRSRALLALGRQQRKGREEGREEGDEQSIVSAILLAGVGRSLTTQTFRRNVLGAILSEKKNETHASRRN